MFCNTVLPRRTLAGIALLILCLTPPVLAQGVVYRAYLPVSVYRPVTPNVVTALRPVVAPPVVYKAAAIYQPLVTYKLATTYQPVTTYEPTTTYRPVTTYEPTTNYVAETTEAVGPTIVLRPLFVPGQPLRNTWRALAR